MNENTGYVKINDCDINLTLTCLKCRFWSIVAHTYNQALYKTETGGLLQVPGQLELYNE